MSVQTKPPQVATAATELVQLPARTRVLRHGLRMHIRGRTVHLRGLRRPPTGVWRWLALLGPGLIAATAGDDAGGVVTYTSVGAKLGYDLLWLLLVLTVSLGVVQEMCTRLGAASGRGLLDLIRERFGIGWAMLAIVVVLVANGGVLVTEFAGIAAAADLFGLHRYLVVPLCAAVLGYLVVAGSYRRVEKLFLAMALVFFAYPVAAIVSHPDWGAVARGAFRPTLRSDPDYLLLAVGLLGTTITPYMQLFAQSSVVERGVARRHYGSERIDAYSGAFFSNVIAAFIIIAAGATIHRLGGADIGTAADAAQALAPVAGAAAATLFAIGLLGASLLAAGVLPLATAYSVSEAFGFRKGINLDPRRAPVFFGLFGTLLVVTAALALIPGVPIVPLLVGVQVLNGVLLPIILVFILLLANDRAIAGELRNRLVDNVLGWGTAALVTGAVAILLGTQALSLVGITVLGGG